MTAESLAYLLHRLLHSAGVFLRWVMRSDVRETAVLQTARNKERAGRYSFEEE
jgi:hypothetical protein